jgi:hypothetical protein
MNRQPKKKPPRRKRRRKIQKLIIHKMNNTLNKHSTHSSLIKPYSLTFTILLEVEE